MRSSFSALMFSPVFKFPGHNCGQPNQRLAQLGQGGLRGTPAGREQQVDAVRQSGLVQAERFPEHTAQSGAHNSASGFPANGQPHTGVTQIVAQCADKQQIIAGPGPPAAQLVETVVAADPFARPKTLSGHQKGF